MNILPVASPLHESGSGDCPGPGSMLQPGPPQTGNPDSHSERIRKHFAEISIQAQTYRHPALLS